MWLETAIRIRTSLSDAASLMRIPKGFSRWVLIAAAAAAKAGSGRPLYGMSEDMP
jgi:hypothetical protein